MLPYQQYQNQLVDQAALMLTLSGKVSETQQLLANQTTFRLRTPDLNITVGFINNNNFIYLASLKSNIFQSASQPYLNKKQQMTKNKSVIKGKSCLRFQERFKRHY